MSSTSISFANKPHGWWRSAGTSPTADFAAARAILGNLKQSVAILTNPAGLAVASGGITQFGEELPGPEYVPMAGYLPPVHLPHLGDAAFLQRHNLRFPYMTGAMANGIASAEIVEAMGHAEMLGSFGAAGLSIERVTAAIDRLQANLGDKTFCINLIHSPGEPTHEMATVELFLNKGVKLIEASAFLDLTPAIVRYRVAGLKRASDGTVTIENRIIAKVSRTEVATKFLSPPSERLLRELVQAQQITQEQAELAATIPMCDDLTAEADSGGHTDNRPAITLLPTMLALRDRLAEELKLAFPPSVGLGGGLSTPASIAAAFAMGAGYVVTGTVNQACIESGSSDTVRKMLAEAGQADVAMAPAADMFEMGVKLQVLKRGTMFPMRAAKLYELYRQFPAWEAIPTAERSQLEKSLFRKSFDEVWAETHGFFQRRDPSQLVKAENDPRHKMALVFRWYLGLSSRWANIGETTRQLDYQVWCGPAMGAFNEWVKGSHLELPEKRTVVGVARNLLYGAGLHLRRESARQQGVTLPSGMVATGPWTEEELAEQV